MQVTYPVGTVDEAFECVCLSKSTERLDHNRRQRNGSCEQGGLRLAERLEMKCLETIQDYVNKLKENYVTASFSERIP